MKKSDFMDKADVTVQTAYMKFKTAIFNLLNQAWVEGKCNAESDVVTKILKDAIEPLKEQPQIVQCKDCKYRGNASRCIIEAYSRKSKVEWEAFISGDWYCAGGERIGT